jgi:hypothetical protein
LEILLEQVGRFLAPDDFSGDVHGGSRRRHGGAGTG